MRETLYNTALARHSLPIATRTAATTVNGTGVDRWHNRDFFRVATVVVHTGTITDGTHTIEVQDSDDNSTFAAVADQYLQGTEPAIGASDDNSVFEVGYIGPKRYLRVSVTTAGATSGGTLGAVVLLGQPSHPPVIRT